ncbi:hypothetical protein BZG36_02725 [Bifiguratus adelaidae]|uniref:Homeobox domain-containing protein n=1 Tax=Bifiguratus adelaidae TaxID=1938954 RepID=A0A261XYL9_9FUNG|nr:hypothetical protein BZG36_02725 [Bifiguratus adelaidae]
MSVHSMARVGEPPLKKKYIGVSLANPYESDYSTPPLVRSFSDTVEYTKYCESSKSSSTDSDGGEEHDQQPPISMSSSTTTSEPTSPSSTLKRKRTRANPEQLAVLENTFAENSSPTSRMREHLAAQLGMSERSIQIWFQNRRAKLKVNERKAHQHPVDGEKKTRQPPNMFPFRPPITPFTHPHPHKTQRAYSEGVLTTSKQAVPMPAYPPYTAGVPAPTNMVTATKSHLHVGVPMVPGVWPPQPYVHAQPPNSPIPSKNHMSPSQRASAPPNTPYIHHSPPIIKSALTKRLTRPSTSRVSMSPRKDTPLNQSLRDEQEDPGSVLSIDTINVGSWRRMMRTSNDLICYYHLGQRKLRWHVQDGASQFRMEFSFEAVTSLEMIDIDAMYACIEIDLNESPMFFMKGPSNKPSTAIKKSSAQQKPKWVQCGDFTEGKQATKFFHHTLTGLAQPLRQQLLEITRQDKGMHRVSRISYPPSSPYHHPDGQPMRYLSVPPTPMYLPHALPNVPSEFMMIQEPIRRAASVPHIGDWNPLPFGVPPTPSPLSLSIQAGFFAEPPAPSTLPTPFEQAGLETEVDKEQVQEQEGQADADADAQSHPAPVPGTEAEPDLTSEFTFNESDFFYP